MATAAENSTVRMTDKTSSTLYSTKKDTLNERSVQSPACSNSDVYEDKNPSHSVLAKIDNTVIPNARVTPLLVLSIVATVGGSSTQFGYNTGVINSPEKAIRSSFNATSGVQFTDLEWAFTVSIYLIGGMLGSILAGPIADLIGRKWSLLGNNAIILAGVALESFAVHPVMLISGRFVVGINSGFNTVLAPMYLSEISPIKYRGSIGVFHQLGVTLTILLSQVLGIKQLLGQTDDHFHAWRILLSVPVVFAAVQILTLPFCPESPKYLLIRRGKEQSAKEALIKLSGNADELQAMKEEHEEAASSTPVLQVVVNLVQDPALRRALFVSVVLHLSQQLSGIGSVLYYSTDTFSYSGIGFADLATIVVGVVLVLGTIVTIFLIERFGRRTLMLHGLGGMAVGFLMFTSMFCFKDGFYGEDYNSFNPYGVAMLVFTFFVTFSFALGPGAIPWLMVSELFEQETRPIAVSIATVVNWLSNFVIGLTFKYMLNSLKPYVTVVFAVSSGLFWLLLFLFLPETKGKSVDEVTEHFKHVTSKKGGCCSGLEINWKYTHRVTL